jgi:hypothetical protein
VLLVLLLLLVLSSLHFSTTTAATTAGTVTATAGAAVTGEYVFQEAALLLNAEEVDPLQPPLVDLNIFHIRKGKERRKNCDRLAEKYSIDHYRSEVSVSTNKCGPFIDSI